VLIDKPVIQHSSSALSDHPGSWGPNSCGRTPHTRAAIQKQSTPSPPPRFLVPPSDGLRGLGPIFNGLRHALPHGTSPPSGRCATIVSPVPVRAARPRFQTETAKFLPGEVQQRPYPKKNWKLADVGHCARLHRPHNPPNVETARRPGTASLHWAGKGDHEMRLRFLPPPWNHLVAVAGRSQERSGPEEKDLSRPGPKSVALDPRRPLGSRQAAPWRSTGGRMASGAPRRRHGPVGLSGVLGSDQAVAWSLTAGSADPRRSLSPLAGFVAFTAAGPWVLLRPPSPSPVRWWAWPACWIPARHVPGPTPFDGRKPPRIPGRWLGGAAGAG